MSLRVAVDFGTSSTCVVASVGGREPQIVVIDGHPLLPSAVYAAKDGTLFVGQEAERHAAVDPSRYEPHPKRRIDEGELLLGSSVVAVRDAVGAVLRRAVAEARRFAGDAEVDLLVLTHPAEWGVVRSRLLRQAAANLAREVSLVPEPVAAAVFHAATFGAHAGMRSGAERTVEFSGQVGDSLAVLDVGGGTVDVSVVRRGSSEQERHSPAARRGGFRVLATRGDPGFGGSDVDQALLEHVGALVSGSDVEAWRELVHARELADRRRRRVVRQDVRGAKETLSRHTFTDVPLPEPFADAHVTRADLESLILEPLVRVVGMTSAAIAEAGLRPKQLTGVFLVGGSSRIPMISRLVHERVGIVPTTLDQPETVVARGAMRAVLVESDRTGALPGAQQAQGSGHPLAQQRTAAVGPGQRPREHGPTPGGVGGQRGVPGAAGGPGVPAWASGSAAGGHAVRAQPAAAYQPQHVGSQNVGLQNVGPQDEGKRRRVWPWLVGSVVALLAGVAATLTIVWSGDDEGTAIAEHDFRFVAPDDWERAGVDRELQKVGVRPSSASETDALVVAQQFDLNVDVDAEFDAFADELERLIADEGDRYAEFDRDATYAGRDVIYYTQPGENTATNWFVLAEGRVQVSVGCQSTDSGVERVEKACEQVVRTLEISG